MTTALQISVNSFQFMMPLYPPCHLILLSVLVLIFDSGEREREFLSSLSAMRDAFSRLQIRQMRQTKLEEYFNQRTSVCLKEKNNEHANREK